MADRIRSHPTPTMHTVESAIRDQSHARIRVARHFRASPSCVFDAWLDPQTARLWLFATAMRPMARVRMDARAGGSFSLVERSGGAETEYAGEYIELVRPRRLVFTLRLPDITRVAAEFVPLKTGCELVVTHDRLPPRLAGAMQARWTGVLYGLGVLLARRAGRGHTAAPAAVRRA